MGGGGGGSLKYWSDKFLQKKKPSSSCITIRAEYGLVQLNCVMYVASIFDKILCMQSPINEFIVNEFNKGLKIHKSTDYLLLTLFRLVENVDVSHRATFYTIISIIYLQCI